MIRLSVGIFCALVAAAAARGQTLPASVPGAVPSAAMQARSREMIRKVFEKDYAKTAAADRQALARLLLKQGQETPDDAVARYVAFHEAMELAAGAGDAVTAFAAIHLLAGSYAVDELGMRRQALAKAHAASSAPAESEAVMRLALETADLAARADAFDAVAQLANLAEGAANKTRQVRVAASIQSRLEELRSLASDFPRVTAAQTRLQQSPDDGAAHLVVGRFYALQKGQWEKGLPHLAAGSDSVLRELAAKELAKPADGFSQAALGDAWWDYAEKSTGIIQRTTQAHARDLYKTARETIQGITLARIDARLATAAPVTQPSAAALPAGAINLLELIDPAKDAAEGRWTRTADALECQNGPYATLRLPYAVPEEYDLRATFTRTEGSGQVALLLVQGKKAFGFVVDIKGEARFESIDGKAAQDNPTVVPASLQNGRKATLTAEVRKDRVRALLDGKLLVEYKTDYKDMSRYSVWKLEDTTLCGIGAHNARVRFESVELVEVTGKGKAVR